MSKFDFEAYRLELVAKGYRLDENHERATDGWLTAEGQKNAQDQYLHNITISLENAIELAGGRGTPGGDAVSGLYHTINAQALSTYLWLKHVQESGMPAVEVTPEPARFIAVNVPSKPDRVRKPKRARISRILEAIPLLACDECGARRGDPCRTSGGRTRAPHATRP